MTSFIHLLGTFPLAVGFSAQIAVLACALKSGEKPAVVQAGLLMLALGLISASLLLRPKVAPVLPADILGCVAAVLLLTPGVEAVRKLRAKDS